MGMSGRAMIEALIAGESDPAKLARLASYRLKTSQEKLREALRGRVTKHHRFLLRLHLSQIDSLDASIATIEQKVESAMAHVNGMRQNSAPLSRSGSGCR
jgi:transposase